MSAKSKTPTTNQGSNMNVNKNKQSQPQPRTQVGSKTPNLVKSDKGNVKSMTPKRVKEIDPPVEVIEEQLDNSVDEAPGKPKNNSCSVFNIKTGLIIPHLVMKKFVIKTLDTLFETDDIPVFSRKRIEEIKRKKETERSNKKKDAPNNSNKDVGGEDGDPVKKSKNYMFRDYSYGALIAIQEKIFKRILDNSLSQAVPGEGGDVKRIGATGILESTMRMHQDNVVNYSGLGFASYFKPYFDNDRYDPLFKYWDSLGVPPGVLKQLKAKYLEQPEYVLTANAMNLLGFILHVVTSDIIRKVFGLLLSKGATSITFSHILDALYIGGNLSNHTIDWLGEEVNRVEAIARRLTSEKAQAKADAKAENGGDGEPNDVANNEANNEDDNGEDDATGENGADDATGEEQVDNAEEDGTADGPDDVSENPED